MSRIIRLVFMILGMMEVERVIFIDREIINHSLASSAISRMVDAGTYGRISSNSTDGRIGPIFSKGKHGSTDRRFGPSY